MFFKEFCVPRIADLGRDGKVSLNAMMGIMENLGAHQCTFVKDDVFENVMKGISWVCTNWRIRILKAPAGVGELEVSTWARAKETGATVLRGYTICSRNGQELVVAEAKFVRMNFLTGKLIEITDELYQLYEPEEKAPFEDEMKKLAPPERYEAEKQVTLRESDIDFNGHVHNTRYLDIAAAGIPEGNPDLNQAREINIAFRKPVRGTDEVTVQYAKTETGCFLTVNNAQGVCCFIQADYADK